MAELQSEAEALEDFPTAENISRRPPLIPNATRKLQCML
jgi:hypothetical protein